jgi:hypothetical protein
MNWALVFSGWVAITLGMGVAAGPPAPGWVTVGFPGKTALKPPYGPVIGELLVAGCVVVVPGITTLAGVPVWAMVGFTGTAVFKPPNNWLNRKLLLPFSCGFARVVVAVALDGVTGGEPGRTALAPP